LLCTCTCPDWDDPCKHGVAALLALAAELSARPEFLVAWRCGEGDSRPPTRVGSRARADRHLRLVPPTPPQSPFDTPEWHDFVGDQVHVPHCVVSSEPLMLPSMHLDRTDVSDTIRSAWQALSRFGADNDAPE
jgi:hypothetical protein